jgi:hypothetical protein
MAMLDGLRNIFMQSLKFCKSKVAYDILVEKWNKECEEVYKYKQALIAEERAKHQPTADVVEVKHGKWIWTENGEADYEQFWVCSVCKEKSYIKTKFCSDCGAKMDVAKSATTERKDT